MIPFGADDTFNVAYHGACPWRKWVPNPDLAGVNPANSMIGGGVENGLVNPPKYIASENAEGATIGYERARDWYEKGWVNKNVLQLNTSMFALYDNSLQIFQNNILAQHPVILGLFTGAGGRFILYRPGMPPPDGMMMSLPYSRLSWAGVSGRA